MKTKRGQTDVIVTVLLVLIALAAVAFIATFIINQVRQGANSAGVKTDCLKLTDFSIESAINSTSTTTNVVVSREADDGIAIKEIRFYVNDKSVLINSTVPAAFEKVTYTVSAKVGDVVKAYLVLNSSGKVCENPASKTVTA
jgi:hypothetical protein